MLLDLHIRYNNNNDLQLHRVETNRSEEGFCRSPGLIISFTDVRSYYLVSVTDSLKPMSNSFYRAQTSVLIHLYEIYA